MKGTVATALLAMLCLATIIQCNAKTGIEDFEFSEDGGTDGTGSSECQAYCDKQKECSSDWFDDMFDSMAKCVENCDEAQEFSDVVICTLLCDNGLACEDWLACENDCYNAGDADADSDGDGDSDSDSDLDIDTDGDDLCGGFDESEVHVGDVTVVDNDDVNALKAIACVDGNLEIDATGLTSLELPDLRVVTGNVRAQHTPLTLLNLLNLVVIGDNFDILRNPELYDVGLTTLEHIQGFTNVYENPELYVLSIPSLRRAGWGIDVYTNAAMVRVSFRRLEKVVGWLQIHDNPALEEIEADGLNDVGDKLEIQRNAKLPTCDATRIVDQLTEMGTICIRGNLPDGCDDDFSGCN